MYIWNFWLSSYELRTKPKNPADTWNSNFLLYRQKTIFIALNSGKPFQWALIDGYAYDGRIMKNKLHVVAASGIVILQLKQKISISIKKSSLHHQFHLESILLNTDFWSSICIWMCQRQCYDFMVYVYFDRNNPFILGQ